MLRKKGVVGKFVEFYGDGLADLPPPKSLADYGHTEPKRGAEWWGEDLLVTFGSFQK
ncbi:hypothetical protein METHPM2_2280001 [Pseudomonas sp. PM2]